MTFADHVRAYRRRLGMTQTELADLLDVSPRSVWGWEHGEAGTLPHVLAQEGALDRLERALGPRIP